MSYAPQAENQVRVFGITDNETMSLLQVLHFLTVTKDFTGEIIVSLEGGRIDEIFVSDFNQKS